MRIIPLRILISIICSIAQEFYSNDSFLPIKKKKKKKKNSTQMIV